MKDGKELLGFLKYEIEKKESGVYPLKNELLYFQEILKCAKDLYHVTNRKNTNHSLERGPLPSIKEVVVEDNASSLKKLETYT